MDALYQLLNIKISYLFVITKKGSKNVCDIGSIIRLLGIRVNCSTLLDRIIISWIYFYYDPDVEIELHGSDFSSC